MISAAVYSNASIRRNALRTGTMLLALSSLCPIASMAQERELGKANIPFAFSAGREILPPGEYRLVQITSGMYQLKSKDARISQFFTATNMDVPKDPKLGRLEFHCYGDRYFLQSAWSGVAGRGMKLPTQTAEKKYAAQRIASQPLPAGTVVAMQTRFTRP